MSHIIIFSGIAMGGQKGWTALGSNQRGWQKLGWN